MNRAHRVPSFPAHVAMLLAFMALGAVPAAEAARGGPDGGGYYWADSDDPTVDKLIPGFSSSSPFVGLTDDSFESVTLPFSFPFYGVNYTTIWVSSNGWLSFELPIDSYPSSTPIPNIAPPDNLLAFLWADLDATGGSTTHGPTTDGGYKVFYRVLDKGSGGLVQAEVVLWPDGVIKVYLAGVSDEMTKTAGIESAGGSNGTEVWRNGVGPMNYTGDVAVMFFPPGLLDCSTATPVTCNTVLFGENNVGSSVVDKYGCAPDHLGPEKVYQFDLARTSDVTVDLIGAPANVNAFIVGGSCHERLDCITGGAPSLSGDFLLAGTYNVVVDGLTNGDSGDYDLDIKCTDSTIIGTCDAPVSGTIVAAAPSRLDNWAFGCPNAPPGGSPGAEDIYEISMPTGGNLVLDLTGPGNLHLFIVDPLTFDPITPTCVTSGSTHAAAYNVLPGTTYLVVVDDITGAGGSYTLQMDCRVKLDCSSAGFIDIFDPTPTNGTTVGAPSNLDSYLCSQASDFGNPERELLGYTGTEMVYRFTVPPDLVVGFDFMSSNPDLKPFILQDCNEGLCINQINCVEGVPAGDYYLVIDGLNGASDTFSFAPFTAPSATGYSRWYECNECVDTTCDPAVQLPQLSSDHWTFASGTFCGWGCPYAMYVVVECGTEMHVPLLDVETGELQIFDMTRNKYVDLTLDATPLAPALPYQQTGQVIRWDDQSCSAIPCAGLGAACGDAPCNGGTDPLTDQATMDIWFSGNPDACGVYRIEFLNMGGCVWDLFSNCAGEGTTPRFPIYRDACSALTDFRPLPDLILASVQVDNTPCGVNEVDVIVDVQNIGCLDAIGVPVEITDGANPQTFMVGDIPAGGVVSATFTYTVVSNPANLTVTVDPSVAPNPGAVVECGESTTTSCDSINTVRTVDVVACPNSCSIVTDAGPPSLVLCEGTDLDVDGGSSIFTCLTQGPPEYQWSIDGNVICAWSGTATCQIPGVDITAGSHVALLETRCAGAPGTCLGSDRILVNANSDSPPPRVTNSLRAIKTGVPKVDIDWSWAGVVDPGLSGYKIYRAPSKGVDFADRILLTQLTQAVNTFLELGGLTTPPDKTYYQVVGLSCSGNNESPY